jgi:phospholipase D-like protein/putative oligomerization/nucleic acid binding protein
MSFWDAFFLFLIYVPLIMVWGFAVFDIFRRDDLGGGSKALWLVVVVFLPFVGTLLYLLFRRPGATPEERAAIDTASRDFVARYAPSTAAEQLQVLADLHDRGKLSDAEFATEKARILSATDGGKVPAAAVN